MKYCSKCGKEVTEDANNCIYCGNILKASPTKTGVNSSLPAFILGLIGSIFGLFGGICVSACYSFGGNDITPLVFMVGGSLVGLIGACMCFSKAKIGSIFEIVAAIMIGYCAFTKTGADIGSLVGMLLLAIGGIVGLLMTKKVK